MVQTTLESSFEQEPVVAQKKKLEPGARDKLRRKLNELTTEVTELERAMLVSATYDGARRVAVLKFYDPARNRIFLWSDNTGHKPYCFSKDRVEVLKRELMAEITSLMLSRSGRKIC